jgi:hypothetical protein
MPERDHGPVTYTTEDVLQLLADASRPLMNPLVESNAVKVVRVLFSLAVAELKRRDGDTAKVLRRLASDRLKRITNEDPKAADLRDDPKDLYHHEFLLIQDELSLAQWAHQKADGIIRADVGDAMGAILGRLRQ